MNTQFYIASQTSQGCISFMVLHLFVLGFESHGNSKVQVVV